MYQSVEKIKTVRKLNKKQMSKLNKFKTNAGRIPPQNTLSKN